jgi:methyl-accepting chemotaxis protein
VASEVRALAQRSSAAAKEIKLLISASTQHVDRGVDQVGRAGSALSRIVDRVAEISSLVSDIASGAREQSVGLAEVNIGVTQLDQVTQHNAAMVEQSTAASQALKQEAAGMATLVAQFALRPGQGRDDSAWQTDTPVRPRRSAQG